MKRQLTFVASAFLLLAFGLAACQEDQPVNLDDRNEVLLSRGSSFEGALLKEASRRGLSFSEPVFNQTTNEEGSIVSTIMEGDLSDLNEETLAKGINRGLVQVTGATDKELPDGVYTLRLQTDVLGHTIASWINEEGRAASTMDIAAGPIVPGPTPDCNYIDCSDPNFPENASYYQQLANEKCRDIYTCQACCMNGSGPVWMMMVFQPTSWKCNTIAAHAAVQDFQATL